MNFTINQRTLNESAFFLQEQQAYSGVRKIADKVARDIELVFGVRPASTEQLEQLGSSAIIYGTVDRSPALANLSERGLIDLSEIRGKNEAYLFQVTDHPAQGAGKALVIAGSDKRGTIYGLFRLSEMLGVSPYVDWNDVLPKRQDEFAVAGGYKLVSKEPSVRYRGFFINDEWPAFGTWVNHRYGGFNAQAYDHIFELLLRLKGNYLWPAMWSARFHDDGPGLANSELADEYGVVMGASHHEPCLRQGEEYKYLRGKDSIYGDAWNYRTNEAGITRFWADGLKRSGKFENVITLGMRGEADTAIMENATFADNINLLRDVLRTQNRLIEEHVNPQLEQVPRMLALYKEVEPFFYGDEETPGLIGSEELENVILMLCDDNFGNLRTLPTEAMRTHGGGYGMYYHFDYHGGPVSYEWVNSTYLPKVWEQMTMAYDFGVRDLWIVNVGDIATQEFPLAYFLDLAYDFDRWGTGGINKTQEYTMLWVERQFGAACGKRELERIHQLIDGYTRIAHNRRPESMNANVYHPVHYREADRLLAEIEQLMEEANSLYRLMDGQTLSSSFYALVYYPAMGNLNLQKMQLLAGKNHYAARRNRMEANGLAEQIRACMQRDQELVEEYHTIADGKWYGMGLSEHIGFTKWNEDECRYPILMQVMPARKARLSVSIDGTELVSEGSGWHVNKLALTDFRQPHVAEASFTISSLSDLESPYKIVCDAPWLTCSAYRGVLDGVHKTSDNITVRIDRSVMQQETEAAIVVSIPNGTVTIRVDAKLPDLSGLPERTFVDTNGYIAIEAEHYAAKADTETGAGFQIIEGYGKTLSAVKAFPTTQYFTAGQDAPYLEYRVVVEEAGTYEVEMYMQPSNPVTTDNTLHYGIQANEGAIEVVNAIPQGLKVGESNRDWAAGVLNQIRRHRSEAEFRGGLNTVRIYAVSPGFVLEKLVIYPAGQRPAESYLGPVETYYVGKA